MKTSRPALDRFLRALLQEWHYPVLPDPAPEALTLAEKGRVAVSPTQPVVWLSLAPAGPDEQMEVLHPPLALARLHAALARHLHRQPRRYLRLTMNLPCRIHCRNISREGLVTGLSARGCRILYPEELIRDESLCLDFSVAGQLLQPEGQVIYCMPQGGSGGSQRFEAGLVFTGQEPQDRDFLQAFVEAGYLRRVQKRLTAAEFREGLAFFTVLGGFGPELD